jgi:hypothetical protein
MTIFGKLQSRRLKRCCTGQALLLLAFLSWQQLIFAATTIDASTYPRQHESSAGTALVHHPVITGWNDFRRLKGRMPIEIRTASGEEWIGSMMFEVDTEIHFGDRTVSLHNAQTSEWIFERGTPPANISALANAALKSGSDRVSLDYLLRALPADFEIPNAAKSLPQLNHEPPRIIISNQPRRLRSE